MAGCLLRAVCIYLLSYFGLFGIIRGKLLYVLHNLHRGRCFYLFIGFVIECDADTFSSISQ